MALEKTQIAQERNALLRQDEVGIAGRVSGVACVKTSAVYRVQDACQIFFGSAS